MQFCFFVWSVELDQFISCEHLIGSATRLIQSTQLTHNLFLAIKFYLPQIIHPNIRIELEKNYFNSIPFMNGICVNFDMFLNQFLHVSIHLFGLA